jgi:serine/threonine protein kinase
MAGALLRNVIGVLKYVRKVPVRLQPQTLRASDRFSDMLLDFRSMESVRRIGRGAFGSVWLMHDNAADRDLAVKVIDPIDGAGYSPNDLLRLMVREAERSIPLRHPCVLAFKGYCLAVSDDRPKIATEYMPGGSLARVMENKPDWWDWTAKSIVVAGIVLGMEFVGAHDVIHRDLKPSNILLDANNEIRIADFGSATLITKYTTRSFEARGTAVYMAPEQSREEFSPKVDVYSFGIMLYEIVTGQTVFPEGWQFPQIWKAARKGIRPELPAWVDEWLRELIRMCWSSQPEDRPTFRQIAAELARHDFALRSTGEVDVERVLDYVCRVRAAAGRVTWNGSE